MEKRGFNDVFFEIDIAECVSEGLGRLADDNERRSNLKFKIKREMLKRSFPIYASTTGFHLLACHNFNYFYHIFYGVREH